MITIRTLIGRRLKHIDGILRRQVELDRYLMTRNDVNLEYVYYNPPLHPLDYLSKRYFLYPYYCHKMERKNIVNHITFQYLGDLMHFLDKERTIITCHDIFTFLEKSNLRNPFFVRHYSREGLKKCKYIISISDFTKQELVNKLGINEDRIVVIKNGMNRDIFRPLTGREREAVKPLYPGFKKILHVGTEVDRKDFLTLLKAFYLVKKKRSDLKLIRVGKPAFANVIKNLKLENDVHYLSNVSNQRLNEIYNLCDLFIFPSIYEGWGAPGLEAASSGTPVICSDIPIFREVFQDFPCYFPPKNYKKLANTIIELIDDELRKKVMREKGFSVLNQYSWKQSSIKYLNLVKQVLGD